MIVRSTAFATAFAALFLALFAAACDGDDPLDVGGDAADDAAADTGGDSASDIADDVTDTDASAPPPEPFATCDELGIEPPSTVQLPLGETLQLAGDDYLARWGRSTSPVNIVSVPEGASATIAGGSPGRLTPDVTGIWVLERDGEEITVHVADDLLNEDTFTNYNYSPVAPLVQPVEGELWIASPPSNAVQVVIDSEDGPIAEDLVPTGAWPTGIDYWEAGDLLVVTQTGRDSLGLIDRASQRLVDAIPMPNEPAAIIVDEARGVAYVSTSGADQVLRVDLEARSVDASIDALPDTVALAFDPVHGELFAASRQSSNTHPLGLIQQEHLAPEEDPDILVIDVDSFEVVSTLYDVGTIIRGLHYDTSRDRLLIAMSDSHNDISGVDANSRPHSHHLVVAERGDDDVVEVVEVIELDTRVGNGGRAASPYTVEVSPDGERVYLTLSAGKTVMVMEGDSLDEITRWDTGHDPRGLVVTDDLVWTYAWLDEQLVRFERNADDPGANAEFTVVGSDPTPDLVRAGQQTFSDATFSGHNDFSCNNCHIDGIADGLVWNILLDGDVNTLAFRNVGGTGPFLWGGFLPTLFDFSREVLRLVGGSATGAEMEELTLYMQSVTAPPNPHTGSGRAAHGRGAAGTSHLQHASRRRRRRLPRVPQRLSVHESQRRRRQDPAHDGCPLAHRGLRHGAVGPAGAVDYTA